MPFSCKMLIKETECIYKELLSSTYANSLILRGGLQYEHDSGCSSYILGVKNCRLVALTVLKFIMTMVRIIVIPFRVSSQENMTEYVLCCLKLVPLRDKNILRLAYQTRFRYLLGCFLKIFNKHPCYFLHESPPFPLPGI